MAAVLNKTAVTQWDFRTGKVWNLMSHARAELDLKICRRLGDTLQEYDTVDQQGRPLRVVYQIDPTPEYDGAEPDTGRVYVFTL